MALKFEWKQILAWVALKSKSAPAFIALVLKAWRAEGIEAATAWLAVLEEAINVLADFPMPTETLYKTGPSLYDSLLAAGVADSDVVAFGEILEG